MYFNVAVLMGRCKHNAMKLFINIVYTITLSMMPIFLANNSTSVCVSVRAQNNEMSDDCNTLTTYTYIKQWGIVFHMHYNEMCTKVVR